MIALLKLISVTLVVSHVIQNVQVAQEPQIIAQAALQANISSEMIVTQHVLLLWSMESVQINVLMENITKIHNAWIVNLHVLLVKMQVINVLHVLIRN